MENGSVYCHGTMFKAFADFLIGDSIEQRVGILEDVGASYIILNAIEPATLVVCDLFSIKFVTIVLDDSEYPKLLLV